MKNNISDLRNHLFAQLERLGDEDLDEKNIKLEIDRARAVSDVGKVLVESVKAEILYAKIKGKYNNPEALDSGYEEMEEDPAATFMERPPAEYSNKSPMGIASAKDK